MNGLFVGIQNGPPQSLMTVYIRVTHFDISVFADLLSRMHAMHQAIVGVYRNTFCFPEFFKDDVRNILHVESISTSDSMTMKIREGWAPAFQPETDDFLVDIPKALGVSSIIAHVLVSTIDRSMPSGGNFLEGTKKSLEREILGNPDCTALFNSLQGSQGRQKLDESALLFIQGAKSIDALRSISINGVNILSFDVNRRKHRRYFIRLPVTVSSGGGVSDATVVNISRGGCVAELNEPGELQSGGGISLRISGVDLKPAETALWQDGDRSFIRAIFNPPIEEERFKGILNR